jgi:hypothetical protein
LACAGAGRRLAITFLRGERMVEQGFPKDVFTYVEPELLVAELDVAGFVHARVDQPVGVQWICLTAVKPVTPLRKPSGDGWVPAGRDTRRAFRTSSLFPELR